VSRASGRLSGNGLVDAERFCFDIKPTANHHANALHERQRRQAAEVFLRRFLRLLVWASVLASAIVARADYPLRVSSTLVNWQALFMTSPAAMPVSFINANRAAARFPRVQLGP